MKRLTWLVVAIALPTVLIAQDSIPYLPDSFYKDERQSKLQLGLGYVSDNVFAGRKDSVAVPYLIPSLVFHHKSGFFLQSSLSFLTNSSKHGLDLVSLGGGYAMSRAKFAWGAMAAKYFFSDNSYNVQSSMSGYASAYAGYDIAGIITIYGDAMLTFGSYTDFFSGLELSHPFFLWNDKVNITPTLYGMMGTQYYYNEYYTTRPGGPGSGNGQGGAGSGRPPVITADESSSFKLLAVELSLPVGLRWERFQFFMNPAYVWPQSPSTININGITTTEELKNSFYISTGMTFDILRK